MRLAGDERLIPRIRAELNASAFETLELPSEPRHERAALAELAAEHGVDAALRVRSAPKRVELWTASGADAEGMLDTIAASGSDAQADEVLVLRVVETLRARGLGREAPREGARADPAPSPSPPPQKARVAPVAQPEPVRAEHAAASTHDDAAPRPSARAASSPRVPQLWLELAPAASLSPGGLGPELEAFASARVQWHRFASIAGFALVPIWRDALRTQEGSARVSTWLLGIVADAHVRVAGLELGAGAGIASVIATMSGEASAPLAGVDETVLAAAPLLRSTLQLELGAGLRLCARASLALSLPALSMRFEDASAGEREVASWGRPLVAMSLGLELPILKQAD